MGSLRLAAVAAGLALFLWACGSEGPPSAPSPEPAQIPTAAAVPKAAKAAPAPPEPVQEPQFAYDPAGLRDPFVPFMKLEPVKKGAPTAKVFVPATPLQRYAVEELRLVGVVWASGGKAKALIEDPEGKGYVATGGTLVGDKGGKIVDIRPEKVSVQERFVDLLGEENVKVVTMTLRKPEGEVAR